MIDDCPSLLTGGEDTLLMTRTCPPIRHTSHCRLLPVAETGRGREVSACNGIDVRLHCCAVLCCAELLSCPLGRS